MRPNVIAICYTAARFPKRSITVYRYSSSVWTKHITVRNLSLTSGDVGSVSLSYVTQQHSDEPRTGSRATLWDLL